MIDWISFTPVSAFLGGCLIGLAAFFLRLGLDRVMGVSGILLAFFDPKEMKTWQTFFLVGLVMGPLLFLIPSGSDLNITPVSNGPMFYLAALLIGLGTSIGSGCTSGHGICGLARFSIRSLIAVLTFMFAGVLTVYFSTLMKWFIQ